MQNDCKYGYKVCYIHEDEAEVVRWMFNECAAGKLVKTIYEELNEKCILYRGKPFARNTVYHLLANEKYNGIFRHGDEVFTNMYPRIVPKDIFETVKHKIENNKYGKHKPDVVYLLRNKVKCGYCGKTVNSDAGTSKNGSIMRYYKCAGKRASERDKCTLTPIRKETLENIILETTLEVFSSAENLSMFADKAMMLLKKQYNSESVLNILKADLGKIEKAISNLLDCMEQGMATESTKKRLTELEGKRSMLTENILIEQSKTRAQVTKEDIIKFIVTTLRKSPRQLLDLLIKEIRLFNNKIEIDFHFVDKKSPDDKFRWGFCFYKCKKTFIVDKHIFGTKPEEISLEIELYI